MDVRALQCFVAVARHEHFTRAAEALYLTQSAVSQQVRRLEAELGTELVTRSPVALTPAGEALLPRAEAILASLDDAVAAVTGAARGTVRVDGEWPAALAPVVAAFHASHPAVRVALGTPGDVYVGADAPWPGTPLAAEPFVVLGAEGVLDLRALKGSVVVLAAEGAVRRRVEDAFAALGFGAVPAVVAGDVAALRALVAAGAGVAVVPASWATGLPHARLREPLLHERVVAVRPGAPPAAHALAEALSVTQRVV